MNLVDTQPTININIRELKRLLGLPQDYEVEGRIEEMVEFSKAWYAEHGRPWIYARQVEQVKLEGYEVQIDEVPLHSKVLYERFKRAKANGAVLVALGAGPEVDEETARHWTEGRPEEYFFLETYSSAVVEYLATTVSAQLCERADNLSMAVLPHYSPGYQGWDLNDQHALFNLVHANGTDSLPGDLDILSSGMLRPKKSMLAVFGLTKRVDLTKRLIELIPCHNCSYAPCAFRRAPYQVPDHRFKVKPGAKRSSASNGTETASPLSHDANYAFDTTVLERWCKERMDISTGEDGVVRACFHFKGSTCTNMGEELAFDYHMKLASAGEQYRLLETACIPAEDHDGYQKMCIFVEKGEEALAPVKEERPLVGMPLDDVVKWDPMIVPAGCLCSISNRNHKWRIVLQSLHYWMARHEAKSLGNF